VDIEGKALERLATSDKTTIVAERHLDGKMRVTSGHWNRRKYLFDKGARIDVYVAARM
jgi:hypothetical protein